MIIRSAQMEAFGRHNTEDFHRFMIALIREDFPESAPLTNAEMRASNDRHAAAAREYAIEDENSLAKFIYLKWLLGEEFQELPDRSWLLGLLEDRARPAIERMDIAMEGVDHQLEDEPPEANADRKPA